MSMEHLVLGLVLFAGTLAPSNPQFFKSIKEMRLDMAPTSFDDQYQGCSRMMEEELGELNRTEFARNSIYAETWTKAVAEWQKKGGHVPKPTALRMEHAVALLAYTLQERLYPEFNAAVREAGLSLREYLDNFQFKALHFLVIQALRILREAQPNCYQVYRGVQGIRFTAQRQDLIRFGQFASTSFLKSVAEDFGQDTFFSVYTCYGVPIRDFSFYPNEQEVLIPPFERFEVTSITKQGKSTHIQLHSNGIFSNYNCEWVKEKRCQDQPCDFSAGRTIIRDPPLLWGLLLAATALAATGGP
ncbi:erythroblast NAD(P)(+)--arginine ADP-ribosyltransferase-like [Numenius arquata]|uniref:erythroblast NAD(P)(+)--arginine ADP-ribosyltransferase-like n=1 Tax=Numenius arquata TaxID=31919 RepID=UPI003D304189